MESTNLVTRADVRDLRVIVALQREGFDYREIAKRLKISLSTYYRRAKEIKAIQSNPTLRDRVRLNDAHGSAK